MNYIEIIPLSGIKYNDKLITFAHSKENVRDILGTPSEIRSSWYYFNNELRFDFDDDGNIIFVEFLAGFDGNIQPQIYGVPAFQVEADELYNILKEKNGNDIGDIENGYSYQFYNSSVGIFRETILEGDNHWASIGVGKRDYYR